MELSTHRFNPWRFTHQFIGYWLTILLYLPVMTAVTLLSREVWGPKMLRSWGRLMMANIGVRVHIEPAALRELQRRRCRILTFNHTSTMDMFLMTVIWPSRGVAVVKREILWIPIMGWMMRLLDFIPLNRGNREQAAKMMAEAASRMRLRELSVIISPEGTRSPDGQLQRFKLGAFHMAAQAQAPIIPLVLHGAGQLWPKWWQYSEPGIVTIRALPEIAPPPDPNDTQAIHAIAEGLRADYTKELAQMAATIPWK